MLSANQKYKDYKRSGGTLPFNEWIEMMNVKHLNVDGKGLADKTKEKVKDFFKPADLSSKKSGITILGVPASTFALITVGVIVIGAIYYYKTTNTQAA